MKFTFYEQHDIKDCGPTCLRMVAAFYGEKYSLNYLRTLSYIGKSGVSLRAITNAAESIGFKTLGGRITFFQLILIASLPCIIHWDQNHFVVVYKIKKRKSNEYTIFIADPSCGILQYSKREFLEHWASTKSNDTDKGIVLLLEPTQQFYSHNIGKTIIEFTRSRLLLHISSRINISLVFDFFIKLMKLPMGFFDSKLLGYFLQRIEDNDRVENFLTSQSLNLIFSFLNIFVLSIIILYYSFKIFIVFILFSVFYALWILFFLRKRKKNYKKFELQAENKSKVYQLINGMQEIKLQGCEYRKRWEWEDNKVDLFEINMKSLSLEQTQ